MIAEGNAEAGCRQQHCGNGEIEPINAEVPQVQWHCGQRENKCADQERARRPIDPVGRNSENQGKGEIVSPVLARARTSDLIEVGDREPRLLLSRYERRRNANR